MLRGTPIATSRKNSFIPHTRDTMGPMGIRLFLPLLAALLCTPVVTHAQEATADAELDEAARLLFDSGTRAYEAGRFQEALGRYQNAYDLSQRPQLLYNIAVCYDRLEQKAEAADYYGRFVQALPDAQRSGIARSRLEILQGALEEEAARAEASNNTEAAPTDEDVQEVTQVTEPTDPTEPVDTAMARPMPPPSGPSLAGPIAVYGVGAAGLLTFAVFGAMANSAYSDAEQTCLASGCDEGELDTVSTRNTVADIGLIVGVAGVVAGTTWLLVELLSDDEDEDGVAIAPFATPQGAGVSAGGSF